MGRKRSLVRIQSPRPFYPRGVRNQLGRLSINAQLAAFEDYLFPLDGIWNEPLNVLMLPQVQLERDNPAPTFDYGSRVVGRTR